MALRLSDLRIDPKDKWAAITRGLGALTFYVLHHAGAEKFLLANG